MDELAYAARVWGRGAAYGVAGAVVYAPLAAVIAVVTEQAQDVPGPGVAAAPGAPATFLLVLVVALLVAVPVGLVAGVLVASIAAVCRERVRPERLAVGLVALLWAGAVLWVAPDRGLADPTEVLLFLVAPAPLSVVAAHLCCRALPERVGATTAAP